MSEELMTGEITGWSGFRGDLETMSAPYSLFQALPEVRELLSRFISDVNFNHKLNLAFGLSLASQSDRTTEIISQWLTSEDTLPNIEIIPSSSINGALGAYAAEIDTIFLSQELLIQAQDNPSAIIDVLLEELGHAVSHRLNPQDAPGDEGAIFSLVVRNQDIDIATLTELQTENDTATVTLNNQEIQIEQAEAEENPAFDLIGLTELRNDPHFADIDGTGLDVVIIDSGLDLDHPLLDDNYRFGIDYLGDSSNPNDTNGHGTSVAGVIGAEEPNIGVASDVGLIGLKVADDKVVSSEATNQGLAWVLEEVQKEDSEFDIVAVNLSLGTNFYTSPDEPISPLDVERRRLIEDLENEGIVVVAAAGNNYYSSTFNSSEGQQPSLGTPAIYSTLAVGAVWQQDYQGQLGSDGGPIDINPRSDSIASFSQRLAADNFIFAPGGLITTTVIENADDPEDPLVKRKLGTSQSTSHVTGAVVLLQEIAAQYNIRLTPEQIQHYLIDNADTIFDGDDENSNVTPTNTSYPRLNIYQSAIALRNDILLNHEIDGSIAQATEINNLPVTNLRAFIGTDAGLDVGDRDVDFYRINSPSAGILEIDIDSVTENSINNPVDSLVVLFDDNGDRLDLNDNTNTKDARLRYQIQGNTYYYVAVTGSGNQDFDPLALRSGSGGDTGEYILNSRLLPLDAISTITNNTIDSGLVKNVFLDKTIYENIGKDNGYTIGAEDVDIYRFVPTDDGEIEIRVSAEPELNTNTFLRLFDTDGDEIGFNNDESSSTTDSFLQVEVEAGTQYYIGVNGYSQDAGNYNPLTGLGAASGSQGNYSLTIISRGDLVTENEDSLDLSNIPDDLITEPDFLNNPQQYIGAIRDFDGIDLGSSESWQIIGSVDIQGDGDEEYILVNSKIGRWATVGVDSQGYIDFANHGQGGDTRVVGIYRDPLIAAGEVEAGSPFDSQQRFQNDLYIDNLELITADDYDGDGLQETYFRLKDGTAVLHAYMHADGNIQYANYQSASDLEQYMTNNGIDESIWGEWI